MRAWTLNEQEDVGGGLDFLTRKSCRISLSMQPVLT